MLKRVKFSGRASVILADQSKIDVFFQTSDSLDRIDALTFAVHGPTGSSMQDFFLDDELWNGPETVTYTADLGAGHYSVVASGQTEDPAMTAAVFITVGGTNGKYNATPTITAAATAEPYSNFTMTATI